MPQQIELRNIALQAAQPLVHGVSLTLKRGRVLALVGGSGSGKSLTCAATLGILPAGVRQTAGEILADGKPVSPCALRGIKIATIMQNPRSAFNPLHTMHTHARETCLALGKPADDATLTAAIEAVGLENAARVLKLYPFEMSGGMLQRMMIAMAVLCESPFIIADEPTTDLDVVAQARILDLLESIMQKQAPGMLLVTHDMGVVARLADDVAVMSHGKIVEQGDVETLFNAPKHGAGIMTLLNVSDLSHHYAHGGFSGKHQHQAVLNNVSLTLKSGETVALLGRSGCGKSTLARLLVGLESPSQGNISWRGEPLAKLNRAQRKAFRRDIQMVFQDSISAVNPRKTVREILREPMRHLLSLKKAEQLARASEMLKAVDLDDSVLDKRPPQLSGGQLQRVCLARALAVEPKLLILDEAVSNLDLVLQAGVIRLLKKLQQQFGTACLFITHDLRLVERFRQRVMVMDNGQIVETQAVGDKLTFSSDAGRVLQNAVLPAFPVRRRTTEKV